MEKYPRPLVVVADPDPYSQQQIISLLQREFRCIATGSLRETYQTILREQPAVLILEPHQPDGDGLALIQHMQADSVLKKILVACVTQHATLMDKVRAFRAGADDFLIKPLPSATFTGQMLLLWRSGHMARAYNVR